MHGRRHFLSRASALAAGISVPTWLTSCGALIHPERVGQPRGGRLDPSIVLLDGLGLLLFLVPGVIAFIVDFGTGAIYLPPEHYGLNENRKRTPGGLVEIPVDREKLSKSHVEAVVSRAAGQPIRLQSGHYSAVPVDSVDAYRESLALLEKRPIGPGDDVVFRCQSE